MNRRQKKAPVGGSDHRTQFAAAFAHQLRTPLTAILGFSERLEKGGIDEATAREYARRIHDEARRLEGLSERILQMACLDGAPLPPPEPVALDRLIVECILSMQTQWEKKGLEFDAPLPAIPIISRPQLLELIFDNLLGNAVKFSPTGGIIRLQAAQDDDTVTLSVSDDGPGLPAGSPDQIFEPFFHRGEQGGSGLGLALVRRAAFLCGGTVTAEASPNSGSTFTVCLPKTVK